ncbi:MAG: FtsQ-type POTRA domain-containing protein [Eubacteriales bacterium]|nr:FtsQ-type POTRA domain-containing protein [Eubacteriales bacterium]
MAQTQKTAAKVVDMQDYKKRRKKSAAKARPAQPQKRHAPRHSAPKGSSNRGLYVLFAVILLIAAGVLVSLDVFCVAAIDIEGDHTLADDAIIQKSGITLGDHILKVNEAEVRAGIEADPLLELTAFRRAFPNRIVLSVHQRQPYAALAYLGSYIVLDETCCVLDVRGDLPVGQYPLLTGVTATGYEVGQPLQSEEEGKMRLFSQLTVALHQAEAAGYVAEINLQNDGRITLLTRDGILVEYGNSQQLDEKCRWLAHTIPELQRQGKTSGTLYISGANGAVFSPSAAAPAGAGDTPAGGEDPPTQPDDT